MNWIQKSKYHLVSGTFQIAKSAVYGVPGYVLWKNNQRFPASGVYATADEAKAVAEELQRRAT